MAGRRLLDRLAVGSAGGLALVAVIAGGLIGLSCGAPERWPWVLFAVPLYCGSVIAASSFGALRSAGVVAAGTGAWYVAGMGWVSLTVHAPQAALVWQVLVPTLVVAVQIAWSLAAWLPLRWAVLHLTRAPERRVAGSALAWVLSWAAADTLRQLGWLGNGYASLATALVDLPGVAVCAPLIGAQGIGFVMIGMGSLLAYKALVPAERNGRTRTRWRVGGLVATLCGICICTAPETPAVAFGRGDPLAFVAFQPGIRADASWSIATRDRVLDTLLATIDAAPPDAIVVTTETLLPETPPEDDGGRWAELLKHVEARRVHVLIGMPRRLHDASGMHLLNTVTQLAPGRQAIYAKERLVPGAEYLPLPTLFRGIYRRVFDHATQGQMPAPAELSRSLVAANVELGMAICHEQAFALTMARRARDAGVLVVLSDDSWIDSSGYRSQMISSARLRAMESGKPLVRVSNGGRSMWINQQGRIVKAAYDRRASVLRWSVMPVAGRTFYTEAATFVAGLPLVLWLVVWPAGWFRHHRRRGGRPAKSGDEA